MQAIPMTICTRLIEWGTMITKCSIFFKLWRKELLGKSFPINSDRESMEISLTIFRLLTMSMNFAKTKELFALNRLNLQNM